MADGGNGVNDINSCQQGNDYGNGLYISWLSMCLLAGDNTIYKLDAEMHDRERGRERKLEGVGERDEGREE